MPNYQKKAKYKKGEFNVKKVDHLNQSYLYMSK